MIRSIAVVGTGLIGTSVALAACRRGVAVYLSDRDPEAARTAAALGAGSAGEPPGPVDLAVIAVPPSKVGMVLIDVQRRGLADAYTDVGSVKTVPERCALDAAPHPARYVGGHPLAGRERSGPLAARGTLFEGRPWVLTPSRLTSPATLERGRLLAELCGAAPLVMASRAHDDAVALTSHVPHLLASLMAARLRDDPAGVSRLAGQGLRDVTRIAGGDSRLWADIIETNAPALAGVVRAVHADLTRLVPALDALAGHGGGDRAEGLRTVVDLLDRGIDGLGTIPGARPGPPEDTPALRVSVPGRPGELGRLLGAVAGLGADAESASVDAAEGGGFTVRCRVSPADADRIAAKLRADGWDAEEDGGDARIAPAQR
ncbi:prephenate dehydrogenase [Streptomyces aculeolatus]|uniref:prephenate dehydrogenase n=1 Tax=Streptomyces aculeolatus TaxID=270689 RepID=UPI001CEDA3FA|nr:prephenate dehydrogenase [Streptomyces aculeolatus]